MFSIKTDSCAMKYCQDGIRVEFERLKGHYEIQPILVNDKPYFKMGTIGIWWASGSWYFGIDIVKGQSSGYGAYNTETTSDDNCPHKLSKAKPWHILNEAFLWIESHQSITCKYIQLKVDTCLHNALCMILQKKSQK